MDKINAAKKAIKQAGGPSAMAEKIAKVVPSVPVEKLLWRIQKWAVNGVPITYAGGEVINFVLIVEEITGVPRQELAPEVYPPSDDYPAIA